MGFIALGTRHIGTKNGSIFHIGSFPTPLLSREEYVFFAEEDGIEILTPKRRVADKVGICFFLLGCLCTASMLGIVATLAFAERYRILGTEESRHTTHGLRM